MLHVHDLVDFVSDEGEIAGRSAADYLKNKRKEKINITLKTDGKIRYTVPQKITEKKDVKVYFRVSDIYRNVKIRVYSNDKVIFEQKKLKTAPGEMESIILKKDLLENSGELILKLEESI